MFTFALLFANACALEGEASGRIFQHRQCVRSQRKDVHVAVVGDVQPRTILGIRAAAATGGGGQAEEIEDASSLRRLLDLTLRGPERRGVLCVGGVSATKNKRAETRTLFVPCQPTNSLLSRLKSCSTLSRIRRPFISWGCTACERSARYLEGADRPWRIEDHIST